MGNQANTPGAMLAAQRSKRWDVAGGVGCVLGALVAVVALASRAPLDGSQPVNAGSARTPLTALLVLAAGAGLVVLCAIPVFMWRGRWRRDDEPEHERPPVQVHWAWKVAAILVPFALGAALLAAAVLGVRIFPGPPRLAGLSVTHRVVAAPGAEHRARSFELPFWLPWTVLGILAVAVVLGGWLALRRSQTLTDKPLRTPATRAAVEAAISALDLTRDPRDAVIAAYAAMERTFASRDLGRLAPEAPREYLTRVLTVSAAPADQAATITGLFEEARFSTHPISEAARTRTLAALSALRATVGAESGR
jgi:Domain of unknown function (DUF4129)